LLKNKFNIEALTTNVLKKGLYKSDELNLVFQRQSEFCKYNKIPQTNLYDAGIIKIEDDNINLILNKISLNPKLSELADVKVGLRTGIDKISKAHLKFNKNLNVGQSVFVINKNEIDNFTSQDRTLIKPLYKNSNVKKWFCDLDFSSYVLYVKRDTQINNYSSIKTHLEPFKKLIKQIRNNETEVWYSIVRPRDESIFKNEKIICSQRTRYNDFAYNKGDFYCSSDVYFITNPEKGIHLKYLLAILNSKLIYSWLYNRGKRKGENLELYQEPLSKIPIKKSSPEIQKLFINKVDSILKKDNELINRDDIEYEINILVCKLYELNYHEVKVIEPTLKLSQSDYEAINLV
jgi:adenine-specific DNA-methyltransferase